MPAAVSHTETNMEISWASLNDVLLLTSSLCVCDLLGTPSKVSWASLNDVLLLTSSLCVCDLLGTPSKVILDFFSFEVVS